jgi:MFS family permease
VQSLIFACENSFDHAIPMNMLPSTNALHYPAFQRFLVSRICDNFGMQILITALAWQVWDVTKSAANLGWIGLVVFLPLLFFVIPAGFAADRYSRKMVLFWSMTLDVLACLGLIWFSLGPQTSIWLVFVCLFLTGTSAAFGGASSSSLVPNLVPAEALPHAVSINTINWQSATIIGPVIGGLLYGLGPVAAYATTLALIVIGMTSVVIIGKLNQVAPEKSEVKLSAMFAGFRFIWREPIVLGAISMDMFAVLLGGAVALLPIYASDILKLDAIGLGLLRGAPGVGAVLVGIWLSVYGIKDRAGWFLFLSVAFSGLCIVVFGWSKLAWLSILMLALYGGLDMISVYVREILMQLWIKDEVRGRVNAVNNLFIGASNQLGEARAGFMAHMIGPIPAVVIGGLGTVAIAMIWARLFPSLRRARQLSREG